MLSTIDVYLVWCTVCVCTNASIIITERVTVFFVLLPQTSKTDTHRACHPTLAITAGELSHMRIRFSHQAVEVGAFANKYTFTVSNVESVNDFLSNFIRQVEQLAVFTITPETRIGFEIFSNNLLDTTPLYIPFRTIENLSDQDFINRLSIISQSKAIFLDFDREFKVAVSIVQL